MGVGFIAVQDAKNGGAASVKNQSGNLSASYPAVLKTARGKTANADSAVTALAAENNVFVKPLTNQTPAETGPAEKIGVSLAAGDKVYQISILKGSNVYDAMISLAASSTAHFSFSAKEYPGIGYFIEEINGVKNAGGKYWTLYVNGKYAPVGASDYKLLEGNRAEWKFE